MLFLLLLLLILVLLDLPIGVPREDDDFQKLNHALEGQCLTPSFENVVDVYDKLCSKVANLSVLNKADTLFIISLLFDDDGALLLLLLAIINTVTTFC